MSIAVDAGGAEAPRGFVERAGAEFPTLIDGDNQIGAYLGARVVPNGLLADRDGTVAWGRIGGFSVDDPADLATVTDWLAGRALPPSPLEAADALAAELVSTQIRLARTLLGQGDADGAVAELQRALRRDPDNFLVRKQIWRIRHPERFYPRIDPAWQKEQLARERAEEAAACGPDGCPLPAG